MGVEYNDLRGYIEVLKRANCLNEVNGADWELEIGAICEMRSERNGPALLFDKIKGYPEGYRVLTNCITKPEKVQRLLLGIPNEVPSAEVLRDWKNIVHTYHPLPVKEVKTAPILENVLTGDDINMFKFPAPKWHVHDGGRYIGTGVASINKDPDSEFVNVGTYRVMIHDKNTVSYYSSPGSHGGMIREKYWARGQDSPVVMCFGGDPMVFVASTLPLLWGEKELDFAGYLKGRPIEVIEDDVTGLPIPANAEIVVTGFSPPPEKESRDEGPFGEWSGYYASGASNQPIVHVKKIYHRNNPIILGMPLSKADAGWYEIPIHHVPYIWARLESIGMVGIKSIWSYGRGNRTITVVSVKQSYLGQAQTIGTIAAVSTGGGAMTGKYTIVVDDDIDPSNWEEVAWALSSRTDARTSFEVLHSHLGSPLDPSFSPEKRAKLDFTADRILINACKPYHWIKNFPQVITATPEMRKMVKEKYSYLFE